MLSLQLLSLLFFATSSKNFFWKFVSHLARAVLAVSARLISANVQLFRCLFFCPRLDLLPVFSVRLAVLTRKSFEFSFMKKLVGSPSLHSVSRTLLSYGYHRSQNSAENFVLPWSLNALVPPPSPACIRGPHKNSYVCAIFLVRNTCFVLVTY